MITEIDGKVAIIDERGLNSCKESMNDLREDLIRLMYSITTTCEEMPDCICSLAEIILIMRSKE